MCKSKLIKYFDMSYCCQKYTDKFQSTRSGTLVDTFHCMLLSNELYDQKIAYLILNS